MSIKVIIQGRRERIAVRRLLKTVNPEPYLI